MADKAEFLQAIDDAILDADSLERFINGSDSETVLTRLSAEYPTLQKAIKQLFENGGLPATPFATKAEMEASELVDGDYAYVTDDSVASNIGLYIKEGEDWIKSKYDVKNILDQAYVSLLDEGIEKNVYLDGIGHLLRLQDVDGNDYAYISSDGQLYMANTFKNESVQHFVSNLLANIDRLKELDSGSELLKLTDADGKAYAHFNDDGSLHLHSDIYKDGNKISADYQDDDKLFMFATSENEVISYVDDSGKFTFLGDVEVTGNLTNKNGEVSSGDGTSLKDNAWAFHRDYLKTRVPTFMKEGTIHDYYEDNLIKRMPAAIRTETGFVSFHHQQVAGYNGDSTGSELYKAVCTVDDEYNLTVVSNELFEKANEPVGIIKHPMLGRTKNGRIVLLFERVENWDVDSQYQRYVCYSDDEGVNFTTPRHLPNISTTMGGLGTTGTILTTKGGRLVCPAYTADGRLYALLSDDDGNSWREGVITKDRWGHEPSITWHFDGSILMDVRPFPKTGGDYRARLRSFDDGETWHEWKDAVPPKSNNNEGSIYADHTTGLVFQTLTEHDTPGHRVMFRFLVSTDGGKSFPYMYKPFSDERYVGYSQIIKYDEGVYMVSAEYSTDEKGMYSRQGSRVIFLTLNEVLNNVTYS